MVHALIVYYLCFTGSTQASPATPKTAKSKTKDKARCSTGELCHQTTLIAVCCSVFVLIALLVTVTIVGVCYEKRANRSRSYSTSVYYNGTSTNSSLGIAVWEWVWSNAIDSISVFTILMNNLPVQSLSCQSLKLWYWRNKRKSIYYSAWTILVSDINVYHIHVYLIIH